MTARRYLFLTLLVLIFVGTLLYRATALRDLEERGFLLPSGFPGTEISLRQGPSDVAAVLFHGFQCNRVMMIEIGRYLAHAGIRVFLLDSPGHGASPLPFVDETAAAQSEQAFEELVAAFGISPATTALVGHSFGSKALVKVAAANPSVFSTVFIGPGYYGGASLENPKNVLILTGERDHRHILDFSSQLLAASTNGAEHAVGAAAGQPPFRRRWMSVPSTGHLGLLYTTRTFDETLAWIRQSLGGERAAVLKPGRSVVMPCAAAAIGGLLLFVGIFLGAPARSAEAAHPQTAGVHPVAILVPFATTPLAAYWLRYLDPLFPLRILEGSAIVSTLLFSGLLATALVAVATRSKPLPRMTPASVAAGLGYFALVYIAARLTISHDFYDLILKLSARRIAAFVVFSMCSIVFFLVVGRLLAGLHNGLPRPVVRRPVVALAIAGLSLVLAASLYLVAPMLQRFMAPVAVVLLFVWGLQAILLERGQETVAASLFAGLVVGWVTSVGFLFY